MRKEYGIEGSTAEDFFLSCCCSCCALIQEEKEVKTRGGWKPNTAPPAIHEGMTYDPPQNMQGGYGAPAPQGRGVIQQQPSYSGSAPQGDYKQQVHPGSYGAPPA